MTVNEHLTKAQATRRLLRLFEQATDEELAYGLAWYQEAHSLAVELAEAHGLRTDQTAAVLAALSPQSDWAHNVKRARQLLATGETYGLGNGVAKAKRVLAGEDPEVVLAGPKVRSFWSNLSDPEHSTAVTVDRHAFDAVLGYVSDDRTRKRLERVGAYEEVADVYRSAARSLGVAPHVVQAVVWAVWRHRFGRFAYQRVGNAEALYQVKED